MARPAKPISLHLYDPKKHLTKAEIAERQASEIHFGGRVLYPPPEVVNDDRAFSKWKWCAKLYKGVDFVASGDENLIARYCVTYAQWEELCEERKRVHDTDRFESEEQDAIIEEFINGRGVNPAKRMWQKVEYIFSLQGLLQIEKAVNAKASALVQMEDRLFLNPLAKVKNVLKRESKKQPETPLQAAGFGDV